MSSCLYVAVGIVRLTCGSIVPISPTNKNVLLPSANAISIIAGYTEIEESDMPIIETAKKTLVPSRKRTLRDQVAKSRNKTISSPASASQNVSGTGRATLVPNNRKAIAAQDMAQARRKANSILAEGTLWLQTPNYQFGGRKPADLIREGRKDVVYQLLDAAKFGMFS